MNFKYFLDYNPKSIIRTQAKHQNNQSESAVILTNRILITFYHTFFERGKRKYAPHSLSRPLRHFRKSQGKVNHHVGIALQGEPSPDFSL